MMSSILVTITNNNTTNDSIDIKYLILDINNTYLILDINYI